MVYLKQAGTNKIIESNQVSLVSKEPNYYTTKNAAKGKWYFEYEHVSGNLCYFIGYVLTDNKDLSNLFRIYPVGQQGKITIHSNGNIVVYPIDDTTPIQNFQNVDFSNIANNYVIGLAFDTETRLFTVIYNQQTRSFKITESTNDKKLNKVTPILAEESHTDVIKTDTVKVNFGEKPFRYGCPFGYLPWNLITNPFSCKTKRFSNIPFFINLLYPLN